MNFLLLSKSPLFFDIDVASIEPMLKCCGVYTKSFNKGETIYNIGDVTEYFGIVLVGSVNIENDDVWGNKSILSHVDAGQIFAETYACITGQPLMVNVVATEKTDIMFFNATRILKTCASSCEHHNKLIRNLLQISSQKNLNLSKRIMHTSSKSIRGRLLSYLSEQSMNCGSKSFEIPFNRQQLADYLNVDRSAMSNELSKMRNEGILTYNKNSFCLKS